MKKSITILALSGCMVMLYACKKNTDTSSANNVSVSPVLPEETSAYFTGDDEVDSLNKMATLGRVLFYDNHMSLNNSISCASCHKQAFAFADNEALSFGFENKQTGRNSPAIQNIGLSSFFNKKVNFFSTLFWDGRENNLENLVMRPVTNHVEMGIDDGDALCAKLSQAPYYNKLFTDAFGSSEITTACISRAIAYFIASMRATNTRFDQFKAGSVQFTALELEGKSLFDETYNCAKCHQLDTNAYAAMNDDFMDIGLPQTNDIGRANITGMEFNKHEFRVPNLRNVALTAPYMHDGSIKTLEDVLEHYSKNIQNSPNLTPILKDGNGYAIRMDISDNDKQAIVAFLHTLTDYNLITDTKFSNPFRTN